MILVALGLAGCAENTEERIDEVYAAKAEPSAENMERIRGFLDDPDRDVRATAINALISLQVPDAAELAPSGLWRTRMVSSVRIGAMLLGRRGGRP